MGCPSNRNGTRLPSRKVLEMFALTVNGSPSLDFLRRHRERRAVEVGFDVPTAHFQRGRGLAGVFRRKGGGDFARLARQQAEVVVIPQDRQNLRAAPALGQRQLDEERDLAGRIGDL